MRQGVDQVVGIVFIDDFVVGRRVRPPGEIPELVPEPLAGPVEVLDPPDDPPRLLRPDLRMALDRLPAVPEDLGRRPGDDPAQAIDDPLGVLAVQEAEQPVEGVARDDEVLRPGRGRRGPGRSRIARKRRGPSAAGRGRPTRTR